jgi:hypothetical protein
MHGSIGVPSGLCWLPEPAAATTRKEKHVAIR